MLFRPSCFPSKKGLSSWLLLLAIWTLLFCKLLVVEAQKRGDIVVHFMNDSDSYVEVVWVNKLVMQSNGEMVPVVTGPIPPKSFQSYKAFPRDAIELREDCSGSVEDDDYVFNQECRRSAVRTVEPTTMASTLRQFGDMIFGIPILYPDIHTYPLYGLPILHSFSFFCSVKRQTFSVCPPTLMSLYPPTKRYCEPCLQKKTLMQRCGSSTKVIKTCTCIGTIQMTRVWYPCPTLPLQLAILVVGH